MKKTIKVLTSLFAVLLSLAFIMPESAEAKADTETFEYGALKVVSIAPPTLRGVNGSLNHFIFSVYFDKDITFANYKHMARKPEDLRVTIGWANPEMTEEAIDFFEQNGILSSINDCIYFNGKSVREYQKINFDACMIHLGDLGVNNCMNIEFGSNYVPLRKELDESYEFSFKAGLKLPSGVVLSEDSDWKFVLSDRTFEKADLNADKSDAGFIVNYNGKTITKDDNVFTVTDKNAFSPDNLYIKPNNGKATVTVEKTFTELKEGLNYILITCTSENRKTTEDMQLVIKLVEESKSQNGGCSSGISCGAGLSGVLLAAFIISRRKKK